MKKRTKKTPAPRARRASIEDDAEDEDEDYEEYKVQKGRGRGKPSRRKTEEYYDDDDYRYNDEAKYGDPAELEEISRIVLSRTTLAAHCQKPSFKEGVRMCFVRVRDNERYSLYQIEDVLLCPRGPGEVTHEELESASRLQIDVSELEAYEVKDADGKKICTTRLYLALKAFRSDGSVVYEPFPIYHVSSNAEVSDDEYERWLRRMSLSKDENFTVQDADDALKSLNGLLEQKYSHDVVKTILENNKREGKYSSMSRLKQQKQFELESAMSKQDTDAIKRLRQEITDIDVKAVELRKEESAKAKMSLADVNRRNQDLNFKMILNMKSQAGDASKSDLDPFSRRQTRSQNYWAVKKNNEEPGDSEIGKDEKDAASLGQDGNGNGEGKKDVQTADDVRNYCHSTMVEQYVCMSHGITAPLSRRYWLTWTLNFQIVRRRCRHMFHRGSLVSPYLPAEPSHWQQLAVRLHQLHSVFQSMITRDVVGTKSSHCAQSERMLFLGVDCTTCSVS